jgi:hypothetical protein
MSTPHLFFLYLGSWAGALVLHLRKFATVQFFTLPALIVQLSLRVPFRQKP